MNLVKKNDIQTTSHDHDSAGTNLPSLYRCPLILLTSLQTMPTPGDVDTLKEEKNAEETFARRKIREI